MPIRRSAIHRPPPPVEHDELLRRMWSGESPTIIDIRSPEAFQAAHIEGSHNLPESNTAALMRAVQTSTRVVLVCEDGRHSATVARMMGVCGFPEVEYLEGGIKAWIEARAPMARRIGAPAAGKTPAPRPAPAPRTPRFLQAIKAVFGGA